MLKNILAIPCSTVARFFPTFIQLVLGTKTQERWTDAFVIHVSEVNERCNVVHVYEHVTVTVVSMVTLRHKLQTLKE